MRTVPTIFMSLFVTTAALAQNHAGHMEQAAPITGQPYAGLDDLPIKALSADEVADLRAGRGMGFALAAELNGYPGPTHVLDQADALGLTPDQRLAVASLKDAMTRESVAAGGVVLAAETAVDTQFAGGTADPAAMETAVMTAGLARAQLRATHLRYHLTTRDLLAGEQVEAYAHLRGYAGSAP